MFTDYKRKNAKIENEYFTDKRRIFPVLGGVILKLKRLTALLLCLTLILSAAVAVQGAEEKEREIKVRSVEMSVPTATVRVNQTRILWAYTYPLKAQDDSIEWDSSNYDVAVVDGDGLVIGVAPGTAEITATSANGKTATCVVTVPSTVIRSMKPDIETEDLPQSALTSGEILPAAALRLAVEKAVNATLKGETATVTYKDKTTISAAALRGAAWSAEYAGSSVSLRFQTMGTNGVQGQLTIDPTLVGNGDWNLKLGVYTDAAGIGEDNKAPSGMIPIRLAQEGKFGMTVRVAAQMNLAGMDASALTVYTLADGTWIPVADASLTVDKNGYVHFSTSHGGMFAVGGKLLS